MGRKHLVNHLSINESYVPYYSSITTDEYYKYLNVYNKRNIYGISQASLSLKAQVNKVFLASL